MRKKVISSFVGILIDMDYALCIPCVHAVFQGEELVLSTYGTVRARSEAFPPEKEELVRKWVLLHADEIMENHSRVNHSEEPLLIDPLVIE